jgi:hypothetical protein
MRSSHPHPGQRQKNLGWVASILSTTCGETVYRNEQKGGYDHGNQETRSKKARSESSGSESGPGQEARSQEEGSGKEVVRGFAN